MTDAQLLVFLSDPKVQIVLIMLIVWELVWKGIALWKASKNNSKPWFIALLAINTVGILPIVYIFYFSKKTNNQ